jgi:sortase (surface protein transpeptidase)
MAEVVIYHHLYNKKFGTFNVSLQPDVVPMDVVPEKTRGEAATFLAKLSKSSALVGIALILFFYAPKVLAWGESVVGVTFENFRMSDTEVQTIQSDLNVSKPINDPPFDARLPKINSLLVPSIGINTSVQEAVLDNYEEALRKGVWRVSDFGAPNDNGEPIILAAHRFGYLAWTNSYRHKNSFYNLPKVEVGDLIEIDWSQRKYLYEVYAVSKGTQILDYSADLILYTCETLTGDNKIFVYARLIVV